MQITFHSNAADVPAFRKEVVELLQHRLKLAQIDQAGARTVRDGARAGKSVSIADQIGRG